MIPKAKNKNLIQKYLTPQSSEDIKELGLEEAQENMPDEEFWEEVSKDVTPKGKGALRLKQMQMKKQRGL
jgi:hypothetical protein